MTKSRSNPFNCPHTSTTRHIRKLQYMICNDLPVSDSVSIFYVDVDLGADTGEGTTVTGNTS